MNNKNTSYNVDTSLWLIRYSLVIAAPMKQVEVSTVLVKGMDLL